MHKGEWLDLLNLSHEPFSYTKDYTCGHSGCGREVGSNKGWFYKDKLSGTPFAFMYICPICNCPTFFDHWGSQIPGVRIGSNIDHLPQEIALLYDEIRKVTSQEAFTAAVMACRKLLMHIAIEKGAQENLKFVEYVDYLLSKHYAPPGSKQWVDKIRQKGNEANHEIVIMSKNDAIEIITFIEMLLKFIYEFPNKANP
ncbi:MAG TPA: DUF4145 domain-containing protein [Candidatus Brocadiia bacterium]|nr:DUF4145 domain-containing protein [Candidatus Brocadiales bacterium]